MRARLLLFVVIVFFLRKEGWNPWSLHHCRCCCSRCFRHLCSQVPCQSDWCNLRYVCAWFFLTTVLHVKKLATCTWSWLFLLISNVKERQSAINGARDLFKISRCRASLVQESFAWVLEDFFSCGFFLWNWFAYDTSCPIFVRQGNPTFVCQVRFDPRVIDHWTSDEKHQIVTPPT